MIKQFLRLFRRVFCRGLRRDQLRDSFFCWLEYCLTRLYRERLLRAEAVLSYESFRFTIGLNTLRIHLRGGNVVAISAHRSERIPWTELRQQMVVRWDVRIVNAFETNARDFLYVAVLVAQSDRQSDAAALGLELMEVVDSALPVVCDRVEFVDDLSC